MAKKSIKDPKHPEQISGFDVTLENFEGPFDLLLQLISRRELDVTTVALSQVTDEFIAYVKSGEEVWDLDKTSSFLVVAATLLDLKAARLLPGGEVTEPEDIAALEARDLLFARLLQYRAFKQVASSLKRHLLAASQVHWRPGGLEERFRGVLPEVELPVGAKELAGIAAQAFAPRPDPMVEVAHLHGTTVSVVEQTAAVSRKLHQAGAMTFRALVTGCDRPTTVVRFLAVLELYRARQVTFEQAAALTELHIRWIGGDDAELPDVDTYEQPLELEEA